MKKVFLADVTMMPRMLSFSASARSATAVMACRNA